MTFISNLLLNKFYSSGKMTFKLLKKPLRILLKGSIYYFNVCFIYTIKLSLNPLKETQVQMYSPKMSLHYFEVQLAILVFVYLF